MRNQEEIANRLENIKAYYHAGWASFELAAPSASELIWVLTGEEACGGAYLSGVYLLPVEFEELNG